MVIIPSLPEIMEGVETKFKNDFDKTSFVNNLAGYVIVTQSIGEIMGPSFCSFVMA